MPYAVIYYLAVILKKIVIYYLIKMHAIAAFANEDIVVNTIFEINYLILLLF